MSKTMSKTMSKAEKIEKARKSIIDAQVAVQNAYTNLSFINAEAFEGINRDALNLSCLLDVWHRELNKEKNDEK